jgi:hypothetical protein
LFAGLLHFFLNSVLSFSVERTKFPISELFREFALKQDESVLELLFKGGNLLFGFVVH